ncbi:hypothetical protein Tco_0279769 [Tanacetum coccineum]
MSLDRMEVIEHDVEALQARVDVVEYIADILHFALEDAWAEIAELQTRWNGYLRKRRKTKPKRQNRTRNGKDCERQSQIEAEKSIKSKSQEI